MFADEVFTMEDIEKAALAMQGPDPEQQQLGADYLMRWQGNPRSAEQALDVLAKSQIPIAKAIAANCLYETFKGNYATLPVEFRKRWRFALIEHLRANDENRPLTLKLTQVLVLMALFDWPDNWPDFPFDIYPEDVVVRGFGNTIVFDELIAQASTSPIIDSERRASLMSLINQLAPRILESAFHGLSDSAKVLTAISLLRHMTQVCPIEMLLKDEVISLVTAAFQEFDTAHDSALDLAQDLFIERRDAMTHFLAFGPQILEAKSAIPAPSMHLASFFLEFLSLYLASFESITNERLLSLLKNELVQSFSWRLVDESTLLWRFWFTLVLQVKSGNLFIQNLMRDLWERVIAAFIPYFVLEPCRRGFSCQRAWNEIVILLPQVVTEFFMRYEHLDYVFCFAVGCTVKRLPREMGHAIAQKFFDWMIHELAFLGQTPDTSLFRRSLVFASAILLDVMGPTPESIDAVGENVKLCLQSGDEALIDGVLELLPRAELFVRWNDWQFARFLASNLDTLLNSEKGCAVFKALSSFDIELPAEALALPIERRLRAFCEAGACNYQTVNICLKCLKYAKGPLMQRFWPLLYNTCETLVRGDCGNEDVFRLVIAVLKHGFSVSLFPQVKDLLLPLVNCFGVRPELEDEMFQLVAIERSIYCEAEFLWEPLLPRLVDRANRVSAIPPSFLDLIACFDSCFMVFEIPTLMSLITFCMRHLNPTLNASALRLFKTMLARIQPQQMEGFAETYRGAIVTTLFEVLTDMLHSAATYNIADMLLLLVQLCGSDPGFEQEFVEAATSSTPVIVEGVARELYERLKCVQDGCADEIVRDFLVAVRRSTVGIQNLAFPARVDGFNDGDDVSESDGEAQVLADELMSLSTQE